MTINAPINRGSEAHIKAGLGAAIDFKANYEPFEIFCDGYVIRKYTEWGGGNWLWIQEKARPERSHRFCHLSEYKCSIGQQVKRGDVVAITGGRPGDLPGAGHTTSGPHLHWQLFINGSRVWPEKYINDYLIQPNMDRRHWVKHIYLAYGLAPTSQDVDYWSGQSDVRIMNDLEAELCRLVDNDGSASTRVDYFNKISKKALQRDFTVDEQKAFSDRREPLRGVTDYILSK